MEIRVSRLEMKIFLLMTFYYQLSCVHTKSRSTSSARYTFPSRVRSTSDDKMRHLSDMHRLVSDLMTHYDPSVVPTSDKNGVVNIKHLLILNSIVQLDSKVKVIFFDRKQMFCKQSAIS